MLCACHDAPAYWNKDARKRAGGYWQCAVVKRQAERDRYDRDPVHRITKNLKDDARKRAATLTRRREALGALQIEG